jgi:uncharacterized damage-inducible protein DinB
MIRKLANASVCLLAQISELVAKLKDEQYTSELALIHGNTIGKHVRHVLEIYDELLQNSSLSMVNYDNRKRNITIETNPSFVLSHIAQMIGQLEQLKEDHPIQLRTKYNLHNDVLVQSSLGRELAYNIEHAIHHMAIIQIVVRHSFPDICLSEQFGVAYSTQKYLNENVYTNIPA